MAHLTEAPSGRVIFKLVTKAPQASRGSNSCWLLCNIWYQNSDLSTYDVYKVLPLITPLSVQPTAA